MKINVSVKKGLAVLVALCTAACIVLGLLACVSGPAGSQPKTDSAAELSLPADPNGAPEPMEDHKFVIYQMMIRLFGNKKQNNQPYGTMEENGVGKFADVSDKALAELKKLGVTHVWYTGVIEHATMDDYRAQGIALDDADVVKGRAGSPYAIKDYYDVNPQLAQKPKERLKEFDALVKRSHDAGLKVMLDFVPNHVARFYASDAKPAGVIDLGVGDDTGLDFSPSNNFYYMNGQEFKVPSYDPLGPGVLAPGEDGTFAEKPPKATGNDVFRASPSVNDWFETVKLNYGVDYQHGRTKNFDPIPSTWLKMRDILIYWVKRDVDGFRCDMAEMVPVEFWAWAIPQVRAVKPQTVFLAEIYSPGAYKAYLTGGFDYLYDKVGLYDTLKPLLRGMGNPRSISSFVKRLNVPSARMLRFLENHDEERIASAGFARQAGPGIPGMLVSAALGSGPILIYFGQEVGEKGEGIEGFGREDNRTSIFDYWGVPAHQRWMNGGAFDGGKLSAEESALRDSYARILNLCASAPALKTGAFYDLDWRNRDISSNYDYLYSFLRFSPEQRLLIIANFSIDESVSSSVCLPPAALAAMGLEAGAMGASDILGSGKSLSVSAGGIIQLELEPLECLVLELAPRGE